MSTKINVEGRRLVKENKIAQIGQGGGSTYTAGIGINIDADNEITADIKAGYGIVVDEDLSDDSLVVEIDESTIAQRDQVVIHKQVEYDVVPKTVIDGGGTLADWLADVPILKTNEFTDESTFGHPVITLDADDYSNKYGMIKGFFGIRDTANDVTKYFYSGSSNVTLSTTNSAKRFEFFRSGNNDYTIEGARWNGHFTLTDGTTTVDFIRFTRAFFQKLTINKNPISMNTVMIRINNPKENVNYPTTTPSTAGTYVLQCTVDSNGQVSALEWVAKE